MVHQELVGEDGRYLDASLLCLIQVISAIPSITIDPQKLIKTQDLSTVTPYARISLMTKY